MTRDARFALAAILLCLCALGLSRELEPSTSGDPSAVVTADQAPPRAAASPAARPLREGKPIDLNLATSADLTLLPGVGPKVAERIVAHRTQLGAFRDVGQLREVRGIGEKTYARIAGLVRVTSKQIEGPRATELNLRGGAQVVTDQQHPKPNVHAEQPCPRREVVEAHGTEAVRAQR